MAEIHTNISWNSEDFDWRSAVKRHQEESVYEVEESPRHIRDFSFGEVVSLYGVEYWFEPDRNALRKVLGPIKIGSLGAKKSEIHFYDYHLSAGTEDVRQDIIKAFKIVSTESTHDGVHETYWENCYTDSFDTVRHILYDYLEAYVWPSKCSEIVQLIDTYAQSVAKISDLEMSMNDIIIGEKYFNDIFYATSLKVADAILTPKLKQSMYDCVTDPMDKMRILATFSNPDNLLITQLDEAFCHTFTANLDDGQFSRDQFTKPQRYWSCSPNDLRTRILPLILFISNWSLVLGSYLTMLNYGSVGFSIGEHVH